MLSRGNLFLFKFLTGNDTFDCPNYQADLTIPVAAAFYVLFSNILLINLVIAKFRYFVYMLI